jgi:hypothetical protein
LSILRSQAAAAAAPLPESQYQAGRQEEPSARQQQDFLLHPHRAFSKPSRLTLQLSARRKG